MFQGETTFGGGMAVLKSLGIKNLRSLKLIDPVPIAPITVLIGKNSVGKSTFARIFPLIRQSVERKKKSPILWFGDYVDFGSISKSLTRGEKELSFEFSMQLDDNDLHHAILDRPELWLKEPTVSDSNIKLNDVVVNLTIAIKKDGESSYAKKLIISSEDFTFQIVFPNFELDETDILVSVNNQVITVANGYKIYQGQGDILPTIYFSKDEEREFDGVKRKVRIVSRSPWVDSLPAAIKLSLHGNVSSATARKIASQIPLGSVERISSSINEIDGPNSWREVKYYKENYRKLQTNLIAGVIPELIEQADGALKKYFSSIRYLKPLRATAERYYRKQELAIHEIDAEGRNLAVFLDSLSGIALRAFQRWVADNLKINVKTSREGEQIMIMAKGVNDQEFYNITDMGFGISQVLPIAAQLWAMNYGMRGVGLSSAIVIEQPELHLHPEFQARMADVFAASIKQGRSISEPVSLIVETHSQHIVNRLGALVEKGVLSPDDVRILLFEPSDEEEVSTKIRISRFDENGVLVNWPFGFFEPGDIDVD